MPLLVTLFATVASILHVLFFVLEAFLFTKPVGRKVFGTTPETAETMAFMAKNQGYYNLFLALGTAVGVVTSSRPLVYFGCACMLGAALVLATGGRRLVRGVVAQGLPPLVALVALITS